jgi:hypothetical protein
MKRIILFLALSSFSVVAFGQSITLDPRSTQPAGVQVNADLAFRKIQRETANGGWTAYNRQNASVIIFEGGGTLNGIADGQSGLVVYIFNGYPTGATTTGQLVIKHEETAVELTAANRILTPTGSDYNVGAGKGGVMLMYDGDKQRWRVLATDVAGGSFSGWGLSGNSGTNPASNFIGTTDAQALAIKTNNLERISIESGGDIGIGITSPDSKLHVARGSAGTVTAFGSSIATFESNTSGYISILNPATTTGGILFGSPTYYAQGIIDYNHSSNKMGFATSNGYRMTIDGTGNVGIGTSSPLEKLHVVGDGIITGNVGIGTTTPSAKLQVAGTYAISGKASMTSSQNNFNLGGKSVLHVSGGGAYTLTGIAGGVEGMIVHIYVSSLTDLTLAEDSGSSLNGNRIVTGSNADILISQGGGATLIYDAAAAPSGYWRVIGIKQ